MSKMYIRVKTDGFIYAYNDIMAKNPLCEVVPEEVAYPERFMPKSAHGRKAKLDLTTEELPQRDTTPEELAADAARGLPK